LSTIITQFVAHEKAFLCWEGNKLVGDKKSLSRLASLLHFCLKWFAIISIIFVFILVCAGFIFFNAFEKQENSIEWQVPWVILSIVTAANLLLSPILAFFEGLGKVKEVAKVRLLQQIVYLIGIFTFLKFGLKLFSGPLALIISIIIAILWILLSSNKQLLHSIWDMLDEWRIDYKHEIFPYQWRIALSWISGYFMFQLFNPVVFATEGAIVAGQMGMTLAALNGVMSISLSWVNTKVPLFSGLIAKKEYLLLDVVFNKTVKQASIICLFSLVVLILGIYGLQYYKFPIGNRFLSIPLVVLLSSATFVNQLVAALATYLRCHKQEPFLLYSVVIGFLTVLSILICGFYYGINGIISGYSFLTITVSLFWGYYIFKTKKLQWHK
jgi:O-antigen/teichoic acid export membrane protein